MLSEDQIEEIARRSLQYIAMYNVINKGAMQDENPMKTGWNGTYAAEGLLDHTMKAIARPNNDTLYVTSILDLYNEPIVVHYPAFDSKFVCLETSAYDHYCEIPMSTTKGDFKEPVKILYYSARSQGYSGEPVEGVEKTMEMSGDFVITFLRVMPHATEPDRLKKNLDAMQQVRVQTLSEFLGKNSHKLEKIDFTAFNTDLGIFEKNFHEVMQFVFNHNTFDPEDEMYQAVLASLNTQGIDPGKTYDQDSVAKIDGKKFAAAD